MSAQERRGSRVKVLYLRGMLPIEVHCLAEDAEPLHTVTDHILQTVGAIHGTAVHCRTFLALMRVLYGSVSLEV